MSIQKEKRTKYGGKREKDVDLLGCEEGWLTGCVVGCRVGCDVGCRVG